MKWLSVFLFYLLVLSPLNAQVQDDAGKTILIIEAPTLPKSLPEGDQTQFHKVLLRAVTKLRLYDVTFGQIDVKDKTKATVHRISVVVTETASGILKFSAELVDQRSQKNINKIEVEGIKQKSFLRISARILSDLFLPVETEQAKKNKERRLLDKKTAEEEAEAAAESSRAGVNFRERILALKMGVDKTVAENKKETEKKEVKDDTASIASKKNSASEQIGSKPIDEESPEEKIVGSPKIIKPTHTVQALFFNMGLTYTGQPLSTTSPTGVGPEIKISTDATFIGASYIYARPFDLEDTHMFLGRVTVAKAVTSGDTDVAMYLAADIRYKYHWKKFGFSPFVNLESENLSFAILPTAGEGLQASNNRITSVGAGVETNPFFRYYSFQFSLNSPVNGQSDLKPLKGTTLSGHKLTLELIRRRLKKDIDLRIFVSTMKTNYDSKLTSHTSLANFLGFNLTYQF
jgi:hypothetical protein